MISNVITFDQSKAMKVIRGCVSAKSRVFRIQELNPSYLVFLI